jgi:hypothetical protein
MIIVREEFERITEGLADALDFSRTIGAGEGIAFEQGGPKGVHGEVDFYTRYLRLFEHCSMCSSSQVMKVSYSTTRRL